MKNTRKRGKRQVMKEESDRRDRIKIEKITRLIGTQEEGRERGRGRKEAGGGREAGY